MSERTVFRLLKTGVLERVDVPPPERVVSFDDSNMSDMKSDKADNMSLRHHLSRVTANSDDSHSDGNSRLERTEGLARQVQEKDAQIAQLLQTQQEMTQTYKRLQEQMYELAHLVLSHNAAAAQAEAELETQAQALTASRRGLSGLLSARKRAQR